MISKGGRHVTDAAIELWYSDKFRINGSTKHKYTKRKGKKDYQIANTAHDLYLTWRAKVVAQITTKINAQFDNQKSLN